jgi:ubiquitin-protein ligase
MEIEINDYSENNNLMNNNSNKVIFNNNIIISNKAEENEEISLFSKDKKKIYGQNQSQKPKNSLCGELALCEGRLINDLAEIKKSKIIGKICQIKLNEYKRIENKGFELIIEFVSFFSVKFIFGEDYPCSPPKIVYEKGLKPNYVFDNEGNVLIESIKKVNWTPSIWLSTLIYSIELLISSNNNCISNYFMQIKKQKYGKRKWDVYINDYKEYNKRTINYVPQIEKNLKQLKIK